MTQVTRKMPSFEGVAAGQTGTCRLPIGLTYNQLTIAYSGVTLAQMDEIRLIANGKTIQRWVGGSVLDKINQFDGRNGSSGVLILDLERYGLRTRAGSELTAIGTGVKSKSGATITTLSLEIDINAAAAAPVLSAKAVQSEPREAGLLKHVRVFGYDPAAAGEFEIADLPRLGLINRIAFLSANIDSVRLSRDGYTAFERATAENEAIQADGVRVPQASYWVVDWSEVGNGQDALAVAGVKDLRFTLEMSGAGHVDAIVEYIAPLSN